MQAFPSAVTQRHNILVRVMIMVLPVVLLLATVIPTAIAKDEAASGYTYTIVDGDQVVKYTSAATDPAAVLKQAGIALKDGDTYTTEGNRKIIVSRLQTILVYDRGEQIKVTGYGETVQALLDRMGISYGGENVVSVELTDETYDGMEVWVDCVLQQTQTYTEELPYEVSYCYDPDLERGMEVLIMEGKPGQLQITADVVYVNSMETERNVITETVIEEPVNEVIVVGTGEQTDEMGGAPAIGDGVIVTADGQILTYSKTGQFKATAYTHTDEGCNMTTATGTTVRWGTVAVDPTVIPYGTRMFIVTNDGAYVYGLSTAEDCGGAIKGNRLDLYFPTDPECWAFGVRSATVYFLD